MLHLVKDRVFCFKDEIEGMHFEKTGKNINTLVVDTDKADASKVKWLEQVLSQYSVKFECTEKEMDEAVRLIAEKYKDELEAQSSTTNQEQTHENR